MFLVWLCSLDFSLRFVQKDWVNRLTLALILGFYAIWLLDLVIAVAEVLRVAFALDFTKLSKTDAHYTVEIDSLGKVSGFGA